MASGRPYDVIELCIKVSTKKPPDWAAFLLTTNASPYDEIVGAIQKSPANATNNRSTNINGAAVNDSTNWNLSNGCLNMYLSQMNYTFPKGYIS